MEEQMSGIWCPCQRGAGGDGKGWSSFRAAGLAEELSTTERAVPTWGLVPHNLEVGPLLAPVRVTRDTLVECIKGWRRGGAVNVLLVFHEMGYRVHVAG
ncbi:unnamed protein product [Boreogadus saida]